MISYNIYTHIYIRHAIWLNFDHNLITEKKSRNAALKSVATCAVITRMCLPSFLPLCSSTTSLIHTSLLTLSGHRRTKAETSQVKSLSTIDAIVFLGNRIEEGSRTVETATYSQYAARFWSIYPVNSADVNI
jgi:hypothetical protein